VVGSTMASKSSRKPPLTDAERHKRFLAMAKEVGASDDPKAFDKAFKRIAKTKPSSAQKSSR
jgi:hypothetical protein